MAANPIEEKAVIRGQTKIRGFAGADCQPYQRRERGIHQRTDAPVCAVSDRILEGENPCAVGGGRGAGRNAVRGRALNRRLLGGEEPTV